MKVLMFTTWNERCGIAGYAGALVGALRDLGVDLEVFAVDREGQLFMTLDERRERLEGFIQRARAADVVHIQHEFGFFGKDWREQLSHGSRVLGALARHRVRTFVTFHSVPDEVRRSAVALDIRQRARRLRSRLLWHRFVSRHFAPGSTLRAVIHSRYAQTVLHDSGIPLAAIDIVPHGVASPALQPDRKAAREALQYDDGQFLVVQAGFVSGYKGADIAVRAHNLLRKQYRGMELAIVGGAHPHSNGDQGLAAVVAGLGKRGGVRLTGYVSGEDMANYLAAADLCVAPYRDVGLLSSAALASALGAGKPIVASAIQPFREIAYFHDCLALVPVGSHEALALEVDAMRQHPERREALAARARTYAVRHALPLVAARQRALYAGEPVEVERAVFQTA